MRGRKRWVGEGRQGQEWLTRGAEVRSSTPRDLTAKGRKGDFSGTVRGWEGKSGGKMDALRGISIEKMIRPFGDGRREEISTG